MKRAMVPRARVPQIEWSGSLERHWNGGDAATTHVFNALSLLFPQGERFFIEQVRTVAAALDLSADAALGEAVREFIAQEAIHAHQHDQYNGRLAAQGYENVSAELARRLEERAYRVFSPLTRLAVVCAYEHYTAALGDYILGHPEALAAAPRGMQLVWGWHSFEETEHKSVCFDLYGRAGGGWLRRVLVFCMVSANFTRLFWKLYLHLLRRDGCLWRLSTLGSAARFMAGPRGVGWHVLGSIVRYLGPAFHPWNKDNRELMERWLDAHRAELRDVKG